MEHQSVNQPPMQDLQGSAHSVVFIDAQVNLQHNPYSIFMKAFSLYKISTYLQQGIKGANV